MRSGKKVATGKRSVLKEDYHATGKATKPGRMIYRKARPEETWEADEPTPPIISRETWQQAQAAIDDRRKRRNKTKKEWLMRGFVKCGVCGRAMSPSTQVTRGKEYGYFACISHQLGEPCGNPRTPVAWLDATIWNWVSDKISDSDYLDRALADYLGKDQGDDEAEEYKLHEGAIAKAKRAIAAVTATLGDDEDETVMEALKDRLSALKATIAAHREELAMLDQKRQARANRSEAIAQISQLVRQAKDSLRDAPIAEKRLLLEALGLKVVARKKELQVELALDLGNATTPFRRVACLHQTPIVLRFAMC